MKMAKVSLYAHSLEGLPTERWQTLGAHTSFLARPDETLRDHLKNVAEMASSFASAFGGRTFARTCGLLHDLGKYSKDFQDYLHRQMNGGNASRGETIHSVQGGLFALDHFDEGTADILMNVIASHHGELLDMLGSEGRTAEARAKKTTQHGKSVKDLYQEALTYPEAAQLVSLIDELGLRDEFRKVRQSIKEHRLESFGLHLFVRMVYSCLVDADRCDAAGIDGRCSIPPWHEINDALERRLASFANKKPLDSVRADTSRQCKEAGARERGIYTLSVPTGGGKTLSSLRFAIRHAQTHGLKRIIYVIPYLSIIDQTAKELRGIFGDKADEWMLEHHSNIVIPEMENDETSEARKLLTERWDRPIIVTTMVRFMETVISNRASDLRRLHNMTESVIVFDEIQSLPLQCVYLFNMTVNFLCKMCGSSAVLCTATQPALANVNHRIQLTSNDRLVSLDADSLALFKRVRFEFLTDTPKTTDEVARFAADLVVEGKRVLVVMNTKKTAADVYRAGTTLLCTDVERYFLSTDLCAQHRKDNIARVKAAMNDGGASRPLLCVSTQLIEAGVDLSFDAVIRANAGIDSIVQAGGRCNRHGEKDEPQMVYVVSVEGEKLANLPDIPIAQNATRRTREDFPELELTDERVLERFYKYLFYEHEDEMGYPFKEGTRTVYEALSKNSTDRSRYKSMFDEEYKGCAAGFATAAAEFKMIKEFQVSAVVPYPPCREKVMELVTAFVRTFDPMEKIHILRQLQPYTVSVFANRESWLQSVSEKCGDVFYFVSQDYYDSELGLVSESSNSFLSA